jgi:hypothetical protein
MNIGIISSKAHAKSHAAALQKAGHRVVMLGGSPSKLPPSLDILVMRPASISHGGFDKGMEAKRGGRTVIVANGVREIVSAVEALQPQATVKAPEMKTSSEIFRVLAQGLGVYGAMLHRESAGPVVSQLAARKGEEGQEAFGLWKKAMAGCSEHSLRQYLRKKAKELNPTWVYTYPSRGGVRETGFVVRDAEALDLVLSKLAIAKTREEAEAKLEAAKKAPKVPRKVKVPRKAKKEAKKLVRRTAAPPAPPAPPAPLVPEVPKTWDHQLKSAIGILLTEMRAAKVLSVSVLSDGSVSFEREVVVVTTEQGSMKVVE